MFEAAMLLALAAQAAAPLVPPAQPSMELLELLGEFPEDPDASDIDGNEAGRQLKKRVENVVPSVERAGHEASKPNP